MVANEAAETEARSRLIPKQILQWHQYDQKWQCLQQTAGLHFIFLTPTEQIKHFPRDKERKRIDKLSLTLAN